MDKQEIINFIEKSKKIHPYNIDYEKFISILFEINNKEIRNDTKLLRQISELVTWYAAFNAKNNYKKAVVIFNLFEPYYTELYYSKTFNFEWWFKLRLMHIKCLAKTEDEKLAINRIRSLYWKFKRNEKLIKQDYKSDKEYSDLLVKIKSLFIFAKNICQKMGFSKEIGEFHYLIKRFEFKHLKAGSFGSGSDSLIYGEPEFSTSYSPIPQVIGGYHITEHKGINGIKLRCIRRFRIICNFISYLFWGYGEKFYKIVLSSLSVIFLWSFLIYFLNITIEKLDYWSSLYFSILTFTTQGYGDIKLVNNSLARLSMGFEAIWGIICISLIIFMIGKKSTR